MTGWLAGWLAGCLLSSLFLSSHALLACGNRHMRDSYGHFMVHGHLATSSGGVEQDTAGEDRGHAKRGDLAASLSNDALQFAQGF